MKTVTVIVPVYNVELYLEKCLESLVSQRVNFDEIILINDGSADHSKEICIRYCEKYSDIKLISQENRGQGCARNVGIDCAIGEYIVFVDSDDYVSRDMCQIVKESVDKYEVDILYYNAVIQYDVPTSEKAMTHSVELDYQKMPGRDYVYKAFPESYSASACLAAYKTDFLKKSKIRFPQGVYFEDNLFSLKTALEAQSICCVPDKLYIRRCRADSVTTGEVSVRKCADMVFIQGLLWEYLKQRAIDKDNIDFTNRFVSAGILYAISYLNQAADQTARRIQIEKIVHIFLETWMPTIFKSTISIDQLASFLTVLKEVDKWDKKDQKFIIDRFWTSKVQYQEMQQELKEQFRNAATGRMKQLPFHREGCRIGVYGIGRHTQALLNLYQKLVGEIQCDLFFIVTEKTTEKVFNCPVFAVTECRGLADEIIVSSKLNQQEMKENLLKEGLEEDKIILLYQQGEVCDLVTIEEVLSCNEK